MTTLKEFNKDLSRLKVMLDLEAHHPDNSDTLKDVAHYLIELTNAVQYHTGEALEVATPEELEEDSDITIASIFQDAFISWREEEEIRREFVLPTSEDDENLAQISNLYRDIGMFFNGDIPAADWTSYRDNSRSTK